MTKEALSQITDVLFERLCEAMESGANDDVKAVLKSMSAFHDYSFANVCLILSQFPKATKVAGFRTWEKFDRHVVKGSKGIGIRVPMRYKKGEATEEEQATGIFFGVGHVFDISQTEGAPLPDFHSDPVRGEPAALLEKLRENITASGIKLDYVEHLAGAEGVSKGGAIAIKDGHERPKDFAVLCHEWAHELLHRDGNRHALTKTQKETEAEATAYIVSTAIGLDLGNSSANYIALYNGDKATLKASMDRIQKTAQFILKGLGYGRQEEPYHSTRPSLALSQITPASYANPPPKQKEPAI
ncbi:MAG TPA: ArdC family protein [Bryobacteraceae bacterium]|jgi:hypothetical protein